MFDRCQHCDRVLTSLDSRRMGFGPECRAALAQQSLYIGAARTAVRTGATADSTLIALSRILQRHEHKLLLYSEDEVVPEAVVTSLRRVRADVARRARLLHRLGQLYIPEVEIQVAAA